MRVKVRATINLSGLGVGATAVVDPEAPYIAMCLEQGYLVRVGTEFQEPPASATGAVRPTAEPAKPKPPRKRKAAAEDV